MNVISQKNVIDWLRITAHLMHENKTYLTQLDSPIGDADHGINMDRGFKKVSEKLEDFSNQDIGTILKNTGMALISSVGGASGPLYGSFYLKAGMSLASKMELSLEDLYTLFKNGLDGLKIRGRASLGEKTIVDALEPAVESLKKSVADKTSIDEAIKKAVRAAELGMLSTTDMLAKKGRASYLGERSIGHQDPGATSTLFIFKALADSVIQ